MKDSELEKKINNYIRVAEKQEQISMQLEKELSECRASEKKWRKENQVTYQQKTRLMEMTARLRTELHALKEKYRRHRDKHTSSSSEEGEKKEEEAVVTILKESTSLEQLRAAEEAAKLLPKRAKPEPEKQKRPKRARSPKKKQKDADSESDEDKRRVPMITESQLAVYEKEVNIENCNKSLWHSKLTDETITNFISGFGASAT